MEVDRRPNLHDDQMSGCRSFGSNCRPSSQSRKVSIGILVDSTANKTFGSRKEKNEFLVPNAGRSAQGKNKEEQGVAAGKPKQTKDIEEVGSPWTRTRSSQQERPGSENVVHIEESSKSCSRGRKKKVDGLNDAPAMPSVQFLGNQTSNLETADDSQRKLSGITYKRNAGKEKVSEGNEDFSFPTPPETAVPEKQVASDKTETLKMKLWQLLGNVSSPKSQAADSPARDTGTEKLKSEQTVGQKCQTDVRSSRQNSDPIETDSESPHHKVKRPVTRSSTRRKFLPKEKCDKSKSVPFSIYKRKQQEEDKFSFKEELVSKIDGTRSRGSTLPSMKRSQIKCSPIKPRKISFNDKEIPDEIKQVTNRSETPPPAAKVSSQGKKKGETQGHLSEGKTRRSDMKSKIQEDAPNESSVTKTCQQEEFCSPVLPGNQEQHNISHPSSANVDDQQEDFQSPTFRINSPLSTPQFSPTPKSGQMEHDVYSPSTARPYTTKNICSFKNLQTSKSESSKLFSEPEISDEEEEPKDSPPRNFASNSGRKDANERRYIAENIRGSKSAQTSNTDGSKFHAHTEVSDEEEELRSSPSRKPAANKERKVAEERAYTMGNIRWFKHLPTSKSENSRLLSQSETSDEEEELNNSPPKKPAPTNERREAEEVLSQSSSDEMDSGSSDEEGSPIVKGRGERETSFEIGATGKSKFNLRSNKRLCQLEDTRINEFSPPLPSSKGLAESDWIHEASEPNQDEDDLTRVVELFALAIGNFKSKMTLATQKKSSEILLSASEGMHLQLQNLQSQIQADVEKLASLSKSKRKSLESSFQEHQKQLQLMHEKFNEDLQQHLQDCRHTLEGMEGHQLELKSSAKKQKVSHQKLLSQVEESVESQLSDAQKRIKEVHKVARGKMLQLKQVIAECLKDDV